MNAGSGHRRCTARNRAGNRCGRTPAPGALVCSLHGGKAPQVARKAKQRHAEQEIHAMAAQYSPTAEPVEDPFAELLKLAGEMRGFKSFLADRVAALRAEQWTGDEDGEQNRALISTYERALDRAGKVLADIARLNIEDRVATIHERQAQVFIAAFERVMSSPELALTEQQLAAGRIVMVREFSTIENGTGPAA
ncbi:hypothetical protein [Actinomadura flavalba]|uniref:hypothetical protein n=1 Tax=Actinomadura flavalba TaxID=1120938 RepID=UPI0003706E74|nr:hypothetical protein [Actinomadura flavalba]